jgi:legumain
MFVNLAPDWRIYALSAANPTESSWGTYCPPNDKINGKSVGTCLGDEFSVTFLENVD